MPLPNHPYVQLQGCVEYVDEHYGLRDLELLYCGGPSDFGWHSDGIHDEPTIYVPALTSLHCLIAPIKGGETDFADTRSAFNNLSEEDKNF